MLESAARVGHYHWYTRHLFEAVGTWVSIVPDPAVKAVLGRHCAEYAFAARIWHDRLGTIRDRTPEDWIVAPSAGHEAWVDRLVDPGVFDADGNRSATPIEDLAADALVGLYRIMIPRLASALRAHRNGSAAHSDAPTIRAIELVERDLAEQRLVGEMILESVLADADAVRRAADRVASLEAELVGLGGLLGSDLDGSLR